MEIGLSVDDQSQRTNPRSALEQIRRKLEQATLEYSAGRLNPVQFNAIYRHYMEQRTIVEKLLERNPETDAWRAAASQGKTTYLRDRYEARPLYFVVFKRGEKHPLHSEGKLSQKAASQVHRMLQVLWSLENWHKGLAQKTLGDGLWLLLMVGDVSFTITLFFLQPSAIQFNQIRDLHTDFERANHKLLERGAPPERMVFPQRALLEQSNNQ